MHKIHKIHFVGIGGVGMSGIAEVLHNLDYEVSGSDVRSGQVIQELAEQGIKVYPGHDATNVGDADVVVYSSAVPEHNSELLAARASHIPVVPRAQMLSELMRLRESIAVAGSHGKTTTTSLIAEILNAAQLDPTYVIGGRVGNLSSSSKLGLGKYMVVEADESDSSFLYLDSTIKVVTNIDNDHLANYHYRLTELRQAFVEFIQRLPFYGIAVLNLDNPEVRSIVDQINRKFITFGTDPEANVRVHDIELTASDSRFSVSSSLTDGVQRYVLNMLGSHNVMNALAAIGVAYELGIDNEAIRTALAQFPGVQRRMSVNRIHWQNTPITIVNDYAHHPCSIGAVIKTIKQCLSYRRLIVCFQPHRYSRLTQLFGDFSEVFSLRLTSKDLLIISEVYSAGEDRDDEYDSRALCRSIARRSGVNPVYCSDLEVVRKTIGDKVRADDLILFMGAGDIVQLPTALVETARTGNEKQRS